MLSPVFAVRARWSPGPGARAGPRAARDRRRGPGASGPTDGPPPEPGVTTVGAERRVRDQRLVVADGRGAADRVGPGRSRRCAAFDPDVLHLHEPLVPGPTQRRAARERDPEGRHVPHRVGEIRSRRLQGVRKKRSSVAAKRLAVRGRESARDAWPTAESALGGSYLLLPNGVDARRVRQGGARSSRTGPSVLFLGRHEPRKGLGVLLDAWAGLDRDAVLWVASDGPETEASRRGARRTSSGSGGSPRARSWPAGSRARPCSARPGPGRSPSASCCSRPWRRGPAWSRRTSPATATSPGHGETAWLVPPGRPRRAPRRPAACCSTPTTCGPGWSRGRAARVAEFSLVAPGPGLRRRLRAGGGTPAAERRAGSARLVIGASGSGR